MWAALASAIVLGSSSAPATQPSRIVFVTSRTNVAQLYSVDASGQGLAQLTFGPGGWSAPLPSPDGQYVAAFRAGALWLMRGDGSDMRLLAATVGTGRSWSRDSRVLAFASGGGIWTIDVAGGPPRQVTQGYDDYSPSLSPDGSSIAFLRSDGGDVALVVQQRGRARIVLRNVWSAPAWSPDGKWIAVAAGADQDLELVRPTGGKRRVVVNACGSNCDSSWSPDGRFLAYADEQSGVDVVAVSGSDKWRFSGGPGFVWSPDGTAIAFTTGAGVWVEGIPDGGLQTLVPFEPYEAQPGVGWSAAAPGLSYQTPEETPLVVSVSPREIQAQRGINQVSADGDRVAYWLSCPHAFGAWRPGELPLSLGPAVPSACPLESDPSEFGSFVYDVTLAGDRLAYLTRVTGNAFYQRLMLTTLERGDEGVEIAEGATDYGNRPALDDVVGGGSTLVYGAREEPIGTPAGPETIWRVDGDTPVQITHAPDDLQPLDVDQSRIVARRPDGALELLDLDGNVLRTFEVPSLDAALDGDDLAVLVRGELRDYSASTGELLHVWARTNLDLPGVTLGEAARGVVAYAANGLHLLRLRDGTDWYRAMPGATAQFTDAGVFYQFAGLSPWVGHILFVPFDEVAPG
jgi:dipeptidyl aminopeptidase/acylaminoacyl peptidase